MMRISPRQFAFFRFALGLYLAFHFAQLLPYGTELFSRQGMLPSAQLNLTAGLFPNPLQTFDSPLVVRLFLGTLMILALLLAAGICRRSSALLLWFGWACLFNRNNLIINPSIPYIGLLLLLSVLVPLGESYCLTKARNDWKLPAGVYGTAWILLAAGYSYSGWMKLHSPSWIDGSALRYVLENPLARPNFLRGLLLSMPSDLLRFATWVSLLAELVFLPLSVCLTTRKIAWLTLTALQLAILCVVNFADLTIAMLLAHLFVFDPAWFDQRAVGRLNRGQAIASIPARIGIRLTGRASPNFSLGREIGTGCRGIPDEAGFAERGCSSPPALASARAGQ